MASALFLASWAVLMGPIVYGEWFPGFSPPCIFAHPIHTYMYNHDPAVDPIVQASQV